MNHTHQPAKGPKLHRAAVYVLSFLLAVLLIWLGRFALGDIDAVRAPEIGDTQLRDRQNEFEEKLEELNRALNVEQERQAYLRESAQSSQETLDQLLDMRRASLDKNLPISPDESKAFAESQRIFLRNQEQVQAVMERILELRAEKRTNEEGLRDARERLAAARTPIVKRHRQKIALFKFLFLAPFVALGVWLFIRKRGSSYGPLVHAFNAAALILLLTVIHEHFPARYYKYMFLALAIGVVLLALVFMIRQFTRPTKKWLEQRCREAYQASQCPVCRYPIVGKDMRSAAADKRLLKKAPLLAPEPEIARPYRCPACGTQLFDRCAGCQELRHTLLPYCLHCGAESPETVS